MINTTYQIPEKGTYAEVNLELGSLHPATQQPQTLDTNLYQQYGQLPEYRGVMCSLNRLFAMLHSESKGFEGDLPISFEFVEKEISECISKCLGDCLEQKRNSSTILSLLRDYKVVRPLLDGSPSVSLFQIHLILQDNYKDSSLCKLFDLLFIKCNSKVIYY